MNGPIKWHGGKHYLAAKIVALMPPHTHYVEPYFGGGAVLLAKDPEGVSEVVCDKNGKLMNFWRCLQHPKSYALFARKMRAMPFSELHYDCAAARVNTPCEAPGDTICTACATAFFVCCRMSLAGRMKQFAPLSKTRTRRGMNEQASAWMTAVDGLPEVHARLRRVVVRCADALEVIRQEDGPDTLFYLDPPYVHETRTTKAEYGAFEMGLMDHEDLLNTIVACKGKVMISGYMSDLYDVVLRLKHGWKAHSFDLPNNAAGGAGKRRMLEYVWTNF